MSLGSSQRQTGRRGGNVADRNYSKCSQCLVSCSLRLSLMPSDFTKSNGQSCAHWQSPTSKGMTSVSTVSASETSPKSRDLINPPAGAVGHCGKGGTSGPNFKQQRTEPVNKYSKVLSCGKKILEGSQQAHSSTLEPSLLYSSDLSNTPSCWLRLLPSLAFPKPSTTVHFTPHHYNTEFVSEYCKLYDAVIANT